MHVAQNTMRKILDHAPAMLPIERALGKSMTDGQAKDLLSYFRTHDADQPYGQHLGDLLELKFRIKGKRTLTVVARYASRDYMSAAVHVRVIRIKQLSHAFNVQCTGLIGTDVSCG